MTSDRVHDIRSGRVGLYEDLPEGAIPLDELMAHADFREVALPQDAIVPEPIVTPEPFFSVIEDAKPVEVNEKYQTRWFFKRNRDGIREPIVERDPPRRRGFIRALLRWIFDGLRLVWRFPLAVALLVFCLLIWAGPTILTPLDFRWPAQLASLLTGLLGRLTGKK